MLSELPRPLLCLWKVGSHFPVLVSEVMWQSCDTSLIYCTVCVCVCVCVRWYNFSRYHYTLGEYHDTPNVMVEPKSLWIRVVLTLSWHHMTSYNANRNNVSQQGSTASYQLMWLAFLWHLYRPWLLRCLAHGNWLPLIPSRNIQNIYPFRLKPREATNVQRGFFLSRWQPFCFAVYLQQFYTHT